MTQSPPPPGLLEGLNQRRRWEALGLLAGGVAHDINNILLVISASAEELTGDEFPPCCRVEADRILQATRRGTALTRQVLEFARTPRVVQEGVDINRSVRECVELVGRLLGRGIKVTTELCPSPVLVRADPVHLEQVLTNLLLNARDAMPAGGQITVKTLRLPAGYREDDTHRALRDPAVLLRVEDTGVGMDEQVRARIFEPFFTTKAPGRGTGLGLTLVRCMVRDLGGWVHVASSPGAGTAFDVVFPATG